MASNFYSEPSYMAGGSFPIYSGSRKQVGGSFFGSMRQYLAPMAKTAAAGFRTAAKNETLRSMAKTLAKEATKKGVEVLTNVTVDALQGKDAGESFKEHSRSAAIDILTDVNDNISPKGREKRKARRLLNKDSDYSTSNRKTVKQSRKREREPDPIEEEVESSIKSKRQRRQELAERDLF